MTVPGFTAQSALPTIGLGVHRTANDLTNYSYAVVVPALRPLKTITETYQCCCGGSFNGEQNKCGGQFECPPRDIAGAYACYAKCECTDITGQGTGNYPQSSCICNKRFTSH